MMMMNLCIKKHNETVWMSGMCLHNSQISVASWELLYFIYCYVEILFVNWYYLMVEIQAMKERKLEIGAHKDVLLIQKRNLSEEKSRLIVDIKKCEAKISQLQKKYDIVMKSLGSSEDREQLSATYFKIKVI